jgi:cytochrome c peroxidase
MKKNILRNAILSGSMVFLCSAVVIDLDNLLEYSLQPIPFYIKKDNMPLSNKITDGGATLGRILFYDKHLSANNSLACAGCHIQKFAFGDTAALSKGHMGGNTGRHAMRLINARFGLEPHFFWDERAVTLEDQTTHPIKDPVEMGYSGTVGQGNIDTLIKKLHGISYYRTLFPLVFGDSSITETRIQFALSQFIRSIQSFDSKFDAGLSQAGNLNANFPNYTALENQGKALFLAPPPQGGAGCQGCHSAPEFDIDPKTKNNGVIAVANNPTAIDLTNTRAPSLRNIFNPLGNLNAPLMHNGVFKTIDQVINHYNQVPQNPANTNLDPRLAGPGGNLGLTLTQKNALIAFLKTLSGNAVYTDARWSDPFDASGNLNLIRSSVGLSENKNTSLRLKVYPNPSSEMITVDVAGSNFSVRILDSGGKLLMADTGYDHTSVNIGGFPPGLLIVETTDLTTGAKAASLIVKQ